MRKKKDGAIRGRPKGTKNNMRSVEEKEQIASAKKTIKRERIREKLRRRLTNEQDIKYLGPLSYRYLRIIAWLAFIVGQVALISMLTDKFTGLGDAGEWVMSR